MKNCFFWALLLCLMPLQASALDWENIRLNGFASQGYLSSSEHNFLADSADGTLQFNEVGLTVNTLLSDKLRVGAQLLSRDLGEVGNNEVRLDWGFGDYRVNDYLGVHLGKVKLPLGLYNEGRDSDFLRAMAFLPQSIYNENQRDMLVAYQGLGIYGNLAFDAAGDLDYQLFYGTTNMPDDSLMLQTLANSFSNLSGNQEITNVNQTDAIVYGGSLVYNTPLDGLRLGASFFDSEMDFDVTGASQSGAASLDIDGHYILSLEYTQSLFGLMAEYMQMDTSQTFLGTTGNERTPEAWYVMLHWYATDQLTLSVLYDVLYADKDDKDGNNFVAMGMPDYLGWRKDLGFGARYDLSDNWTLKAEYHKVKGGDSFATVLNDDLSQLDEDWDYVALKATFNF